MPAVDRSGIGAAITVSTPEASRAVELEWHADDRVEFNGTAFRVGFGQDVKAGPAELMLMKPRWMVERYVELVSVLRPKRIVELGIFKGGSVAFLTLLANPEKFVATDIRRQSSPQFEAWCASRDDVVRPYYGVDQADTVALRQIIDDEFAGAPLDLVIDDASHLLEPTRQSFNLLFPFVRPGGAYVVEDWSHEHGWERLLVGTPDLEARVRAEAARHPEVAESLPLTRLLFEIVLASAYTDLVESIEIRANWLLVHKGKERADVDDFDVRRCHLDLGRRLLSDDPTAL